MKDVGEIQHEAELAAAEERGRRSGVETIRVIVSNALKEWPGCYDGLNYVLQRLKDLAPRDSAPLSAKDRAHVEVVANRYERGECHCQKCGAPLTKDHACTVTNTRNRP